MVASMFSILSYHTGIYGFRKAGELGFEPRQADPESAVLPLHHSPRIACLVLSNRSVVPFRDLTIMRWTGQVVPKCLGSGHSAAPTAVSEGGGTVPSGDCLSRS